MAISKFFLFSIFLAMIFVKIRADALIEDGIFESEGSDSDPVLEMELEQLRGKISALESTIEEQTRELKSKDDSITKMEKTVQERSDRIAVLQGEIELIQKKGTLDVEEMVGKANARSWELEKQVEKLEKELEIEIRKRDSLEARAHEAEKQMKELNLKLEKLQRINDEQKARIRKTERALRVAEEEMMKAKLEATSKSRELLKVHGGWLPPWLATHLSNFQSFVEKYWKQHGKPALDAAVQKASEKSAQAQKWAEPHLETVKVRWVPVLKEQWLTVTTFVEPYMQLVTTRTVEVYEASKSTLTPHVVRVQELATPYFQEAKKFSKPYIDQVVTVTKPHVDKARIALKPYAEKGVQVSQKFLESATVYHYRVQATVQEKLKKHELTKALATKELVWFAASALLALPVYFLYKLLSGIFCKKARKSTRNAQGNHAPRRHKRRHADK